MIQLYILISIIIILSINIFFFKKRESFNVCTHNINFDIFGYSMLYDNKICFHVLYDLSKFVKNLKNNLLDNTTDSFLINHYIVINKITENKNKILNIKYDNYDNYVNTLEDSKTKHLKSNMQYLHNYLIENIEPNETYNINIILVCDNLNNIDTKPSIMISKTLQIKSTNPLNINNPYKIVDINDKSLREQDIINQFRGKKINININ